MQKAASKILEELNAIVQDLRADLPIAETEYLEALFKKCVQEITRQHRGDQTYAQGVAQAQKNLGLILKHKSYGVKACTPLGYSVFLLNKGEGFSFQNHLDFKVELFHLIKTLPGGYWFVSSYKDWKKTYDPEQFQAWMRGKKHAAYDAFRVCPKSGDILRIHKTGIVHTAIGCVLEEYANVSTDMVQRLHDQNAGRPIPNRARAEVERALNHVRFPAVAHGRKTSFGTVFRLEKSKAFSADRVQIQTGKIQRVRMKDQYGSLYVTSGSGRLSFPGSGEKTTGLKKGQAVLLVPGSRWEFENATQKPLEYSLLTVPQKLALRS